MQALLLTRTTTYNKTSLSNKIICSFPSSLSYHSTFYNALLSRYMQHSRCAFLWKRSAI